MSTRHPCDRLGELAVQLGFIETPQMAELRKAIAGMLSRQEALPLYSEYHRLAQEVEDQSNDKEQNIRVGGLLALARVWRQFGDNNTYIDTLQEALYYPFPEPLLQEVEALQLLATDDREQVLAMVTSLAGILTRDEVESLKSRPIEYALGEAFSLVLEHGYDPESLLSQFGYGIETPE